MKSFYLFALLYGSYIASTNVYGFDCPAVTYSDSCLPDPLCSVCNVQNNYIFGMSNLTHVCSQCNGNYFLYSINQCLHCQDIFGNECLHCADGHGCQQCADGYQRVQDMNCGGIYYCEEIPDPVGCDDNCIQCQNENDPLNSYCTQCKNNKWFLGDGSGKNGCLKCKREFGEECLHCANIQGCQQCAEGFNRVQDPNTLLHYCECANNCHEIITFEELTDELTYFGLLGNIPNGYFNLNWHSGNRTDFPPDFPNFIFNIFVYSSFVEGAYDFNNTIADPDYGTIALAGYDDDLNIGAIKVGESGGTQFKLVRFDAVIMEGEATDVSCYGFLNGNQVFSMEPAGSIAAFDYIYFIGSTDTITIDNNIIIDYFECHTTALSSLGIDNLELIFI